MSSTEPIEIVDFDQDDDQDVKQRCTPAPEQDTSITIQSSPMKETDTSKSSDETTNETSKTTPSKSRTSTAKQLAKEEEKKAREVKREQERLEKERAKEEERRLKEEKRLAKEEEKRKREEEKERIKKEKEAEKEAQRSELEAKKECQRKEKEEREAKRLEEKLRKEAEKEAKRKEEEAKKLEEEKKKKEEQKKKQKSMISNFFKPKTTIKSTTPVPQVEKKDLSEYEKLNKFYVKDRTILNNGVFTEQELTQSKASFDSQLQCQSSESLQSFFESQKPKFPTIPPTPSTQLYESTTDTSNTTIYLKFLRFYETIKTYNATYTLPVPRHIATSPFQLTANSEYYNWDLEGEDDEEGEDLGDEDEEELDDEDDEDLNDFLDPDNEEVTNNNKLKRGGGAMGPLTPIIEWDVNGINTDVKLEILKENVKFPVDGLCDYWSVVTVSKGSMTSNDNNATPLKECNGNGAPESVYSTQFQTPSQLNINNTITTNIDPVSVEPKSKKAKTLITNAADLQTFKEKVEGSSYTIPTMVEILKGFLPNYTKATIETTLKSLAKRIGTKPTEKKWIVDEVGIKSLSGS